MKGIFSLILCFSFYFTAQAQDTITYHIAFPNAVHHEAEISLSVKNIDVAELTAVISKSSPGRYSLHNFGKNIYNLNVAGNEGEQISVARIEPDAWRISGFESELTIRYTLFANYANGTYSGIDANFANLNMPSCLLWIKDMEDLPVKVVFDLPPGSNWKIATQLSLLDSVKNIYMSPDLQYLMDSPCMISGMVIKKIDSQELDSYRIRMAVNNDNSPEEIEKFADMTMAVMAEQKAIFGEFPNFRDSTYSFLCSFGPGYHSDAMEHRNSTVITSPILLNGNQERHISSVAHEFFHVWIMERVRPKSLEPFDFTKANMSGELWFGEGFTNYYSDLTLCRAGIIDQRRYLGNLSRTINYVLNAPGIQIGSPVYMSEIAAYTDRAASIDEDNFSNTNLSYYTYGEIIALALDLSLRAQFENANLDDLMMSMWKKYGKTEIPITNLDIQNTLAEVSGSEDFAREFFQEHILGNKLPDFEALFDKLGYKLIKKNPNRPSIGFVRLKFEGDTATLLSEPLMNSAMYDAGVNKGDLILSVDDQPVTSYPELNFIIGTRKIGDEINIEYSHHGKLNSGSFKLKEDNQMVLIPKEQFSIRLKDEELKLRTGWLNSRVLK